MRQVPANIKSNTNDKLQTFSAGRDLVVRTRIFRRSQDINHQRLHNNVIHGSLDDYNILSGNAEGIFSVSKHGMVSA